MDLETTYLGLRLSSPLVPSSSPLCESLDNLRAMEDAGAGAIVLHSLFEEQIELDALSLTHYLSEGTESFAESLSYLPQPREFRFGPQEYLEHLARAKQALRIPVIASLNGRTAGGWNRFARQLEEAGADAVELNIYYVPADLSLSGPHVEDLYLEIVRNVRRSVGIPVAVKLSPFFSAPGNMAERLVQAGADGLVLFNRFYQPDVDLEELEVRPRVLLSTPQTMRLPMRWIAILHGRIEASLAATGGIHNHEDVLKMLMVGADVTMLCSALLRHGIAHLGRVKADLVRWMEQHEFPSVSLMKGSLSQKSCPRPDDYERANYTKALTGYHVKL
jgi:dihydroorotate dehydrogenase (fumarate)